MEKTYIYIFVSRERNRYNFTKIIPDILTIFGGNVVVIEPRQTKVVLIFPLPFPRTIVNV